MNHVISKKLVIYFVLITGLIIHFSDSGIDTINNERTKLSDAGYFESWESYTNQLYWKAFGDRSVIWVGGWQAIKDNKQYYFFPPYERYSYTWTSARGHLIRDSEISIHNLPLELMRNYGLLIGGLVFILYMLFLIKGSGRFILQNSDFLSSLLAASTLGAGIVGALVGQFPMMITFSMGMISLFGIFYGLSNFRNN